MVILGHNLGNSQVSVYRTNGPTLGFLFSKKVSSFITWLVLQRVRFLILCHMAIEIIVPKTAAMRQLVRTSNQLIFLDKLNDH